MHIMHAACTVSDVMVMSSIMYLSIYIINLRKSFSRVIGIIDHIKYNDTASLNKNRKRNSIAMGISASQPLSWVGGCKSCSRDIFSCTGIGRDNY